jgi:hypothetical protein
MLFSCLCEGRFVWMEKIQIAFQPEDLCKPVI